MKRAFFQALVLVGLLGITWFFVALRFRADRDQPAEMPPPVAQTLSPVLEEDWPEYVEEAPPTTRPEDAAPSGPLPEALQSASGEAMLAAVQALREATALREAAAVLRELRAELEAAPPDEAAAAIEAFLDLGWDQSTRLPFALGRQGRLETAPSLRVFLLDELGLIDPAAAARCAEESWDRMESADEFALHLRNYAWGTEAPPDERVSQIQERAIALTRHEPWRASPTAGFAEAFDALVYSLAVEAVPQLARDTDRSRPGNLRRPSNLALDRLVILAPDETLSLILDDMEAMHDQPYTRAGYFARADMRDPVQRELLEDYLLSRAVGAEERNYFLELFPNHNFHHSQNLLTESVYPSHDDIVGQLRAAQEQTGQWLEDPRFSRFLPAIERAHLRLSEILGVPPRP